MKRTALGVIVAVAGLVPSVAARAQLPAFLRTENDHVEDGNALLEKGDAKAALAEYDRAARELPSDPGVQLDRGLALLKLGELTKSREALLAATAPSAGSSVRADAYRNLSLAFYREADAAAAKSDHKQAQSLFREAVDAAKRSLRLRPGDGSTAWNLELAARRVREQEAKQKAEDEKKKQQEPEQEQQGDKSDPSQDGSQDPPQGDHATNPEAKRDDKKPAEGAAKKPPEAPKPATPQPKDAGHGEPREPREPRDPTEGGERPIPADVAQALDSLEDGEENFEHTRARARAARERRAPEKDW